MSLAESSIFALVLAPFISGFAALFFGRFGVRRRLVRLDELNKRIHLLSDIKNMLPEGGEEAAQIAAASRQILVEMLDETSIDRADIREWSQHGLLKRWVFIPVPKTFWGYPVIIVWYVSLTSLTATVILSFFVTNDENWLIVYAFIIFLMAICLLARSKARNLYTNSVNQLAKYQQAYKGL